MSNDELPGSLHETILKAARLDEAMVQSNYAHVAQMARSSNPAKWMHERLGEYIRDFEEDLDEEHEIGGRLVSFGQTLVFHIEHVGYYGPDIITFSGLNEGGERLQLIQHISQLSVLLIGVKKLGDKPRRIGFIWDDDKKNE